MFLLLYHCPIILTHSHPPPSTVLAWMFLLLPFYMKTLLWEPNFLLTTEEHSRDQSHYKGFMRKAEMIVQSHPYYTDRKGCHSGNPEIEFCLPHLAKCMLPRRLLVGPLLSRISCLLTDTLSSRSLARRGSRDTQALSCGSRSSGPFVFHITYFFPPVIP